MTDLTATDLLMGRKGFSFDAIGASVSGRITEITTETDTDFNTNKPRLQDNGEPIMIPVFALLQDNDKRIFVFANKPAMRRAIRDAIRTVGADEPEIGGRLTVTFSGEEPTQKGFPKKLFTAEYEAPTASTNAVI
jgi:hypothetical protein